MKSSNLLAVIFICASTLLLAQKSFYGTAPHEWENKSLTSNINDVPKYDKYDMVILRESTDFTFYTLSNQKVAKNVVLKINSEAGLKKLSKYSLPESFDIAFDPKFNNQNPISIPFIAHYKVINFTARKMRQSRWSELKFDTKFQQIHWTMGSGEAANDEITYFIFQDLKVGDIVEFYYESEFGTTYGSNLFYFNSNLPKMDCEFTYGYKIEERFEDYDFILPANISDSIINTTVEQLPKDFKMIRKKIALKNLEPINYPQNAMVSKQFPYVFADFRFYTIVSGSYPDGGRRHIEYDNVRPKHFEWFMFPDTTNYFTKIYDKQFASIRQFLKKFPPVLNDSSKTAFVKAFCDTLNSFNYISSKDLFYNKSELYNVYSGEHLLKRRLVEHLVWKITIDILNENKIQYYLTNIQDNRLGEHNQKYRVNYSYENYIIALSANNTYLYFVPRKNGVSYFMNELPFYFEGSLAALTGRNFQISDKNQQLNYFKIIKTHKGTSSENSRIENTIVRINTDSSVAYLNIRESLSGQFSTILRHYYLNTYVDSTIHPGYFKKCTEKPKAQQVKIKLSSKITEYPFRHNFNCSEKINLDSKVSLNLKNWFSFVHPENCTEEPTHDYYFDFENTDAYNFVLNFSKPTEIENASDFKREMDNETFSLNSSISKQSDNSYLLKVEVKVKTRKLSKANGPSLVELSKALYDLNNFNLKLK